MKGAKMITAQKKSMVQTIEDGRGWSPDGGWFTAKNNVLYWDDGDIADMNEGGLFIRVMPDLSCAKRGDWV